MEPYLNSQNGGYGFALVKAIVFGVVGIVITAFAGWLILIAATHAMFQWDSHDASRFVAALLALIPVSLYWIFGWRLVVRKAMRGKSDERKKG